MVTGTRENILPSVGGFSFLRMVFGSWPASVVLISGFLVANASAFVEDSGSRVTHSQDQKLAQAPKPVRALLICGGCCHDYESQKGLIKNALEQHAHIEVTVVHQGGTGTSAEIELYKNPKWADDFDVILHDECFSDDKDPAWLAKILAPHRAGKPAVMIHCAMHCYRVGNDDWFELCGVTSRGHGPHYPHEVRNVRAEHEIMKGFGAAWANPAGELYRIEKFWPTATPLGTAKDRENGQDQVCVWTNDYRGTRVFGTTLGHHNETVEDPVFVRMLTRGTLWAAGKLTEEYLKPEPVKRERVNLASGKTMTASSEQRDQNNLLGMAVDGKRATRWCASGGGFPQWLAVDLGSEQEIHGVGIDWESDSAKYTYNVQVSLDGVKYDTLCQSEPEGILGRLADHPIEKRIARFVKVTCSKASPGAWASIRELKVFGAGTVEVSNAPAVPNKETELLGECRLPEGFDATVFAGPPAVNYPVFVAAAPDGTLFVSSDKNGSLDREAKRGSVIRLKDRDGDGRADQSNLYVDDVDSPRGLVWDQDRLYLLHPPHLSAFIDENGDGVSDRQEILVRDIAFGFKDRPADHTSNGVTMGIDGWLYLAIGDFGFMNAVGADGQSLQLRGGGVVRVRPDGTGLELYSRGTRNILEVAVDPLLRGYARDNTNDGGGWDVRMHHFSGFEDHGYPRRYMNFSNEIIAPLADYGGGSGCGALFLDEPGMPSALSDCIYTADWGRQQIYRHPVSDEGASVSVGQSEFLGIERATDLDVDANSRIYAASWKGATFTYAGEEAGYVVQLKPKAYAPPTLPDATRDSDETWLRLLKDPSHRRRLEAQRVLVRRAWLDPERGRAIERALIEIAKDGSATIKSRIAALFGYVQIAKQRAIPTLLDLCSDADLLPWTIRAFADLDAVANPEYLTVLRNALSTAQPRTILEALVASARAGDGGWGNSEESTSTVERVKVDALQRVADAVAAHLGSRDPVIRHTASLALAKLRGTEQAIAVLHSENASESAKQHAIYTLHERHSVPVVQRLIRELESPNCSTELRGYLHQALCRLHQREGNWTGVSWGTRPDTRGPYYQPESWDGTDLIQKTLAKELKGSSVRAAATLLQRMSLNRIDTQSYLADWITSSDWASLPIAERMTVLQSARIKAGTDGEEILANLSQVLKNEAVAPLDLLKISDFLLKQGAQGGVAIVADLMEKARTLPKEVLGALWMQCYTSEQLPRWNDRLKGLLDDPSRDPVAVALLVASTASRKEQGKGIDVQNMVERLWQDEAVVGKLLSELQRIDAKSAEPIIRRALLDKRPEIATRGKEIAGAWGLADLAQWTGPKISDVGREIAFKDALAMPGDVVRGEQLFGLLGCAKCHDVKPTESLRGPYLPNVAKTYKRDQLVEAILSPSKSIAQGFVQNIFRLDDGTTVSGFVTKESPELVVLRNAEGEVIEVSVEAIEERKESQLSVMPEGLADPIPVAALADLVSYLQSLGQ